MDHFERLIKLVERVTHHAYYPGKQETVDLCLEDIEGFSEDGLITAEQEDMLRDLLLGTCSLAA